jgi:hypothetical protein
LTIPKDFCYIIQVILECINFKQCSQSFKVPAFENRLQKELEYHEGRLLPKYRDETDAFDDSIPINQAMPPVFEQKPKNFKLIEGSDATFICRVNGKPVPNVSIAFE